MYIYIYTYTNVYIYICIHYIYAYIFIYCVLQCVAERRTSLWQLTLVPMRKRCCTTPTSPTLAAAKSDFSCVCACECVGLCECVGVGVGLSF